jgi:hypothetical protein
MNILATNKFKTQASHQIYLLEQLTKKHMEVTTFRKENEAFENRIKDFVDFKLSLVENKMKEQQEGAINTNQKFQEDLSEMQKQTLWKIKDIENLMEKRISEHKVNTLIAGLEKKMKQYVL